MSQNLYNNQSPRTFDQLQAKYTQQAQRNQQVFGNYKNIYAQLISRQRQQAQQRKARQQYLTKLQRQKMNKFWQYQENKRKEEERRKRDMIDQMRSVNRSMADSIGNNPTTDNYKFNQEEYLMFLEQQRLKEKQTKQVYLNENNYYSELRKMRDKIQKEDDIHIAKNKQSEALEIQKKRQQQLLNRRQKFQPNAAAYRYLDQQIKQKKQYEDMLQNYIVKEGALEIQNRIMRQKLSQQENYKNKKQYFLSELKDQLQGNQKRHKSMRRSAINSQKQIMDSQSNYLKEYQNWQKARKSEQNRKMLQVLKSQWKPRSLLQQPDKIQNAGIGSPVHIGKYVNDDRRKQLQYIQKSLQRQLRNS